MWEKFGFRPYETEQMSELDIYGFTLINKLRTEEVKRKQELEKAKKELKINK